MNQPSPALIAQFDQALAESKDALKQLIAAYREGRQYDQEHDIAPEFSTVGLVTALYEEWDCLNLVGALAVAIVQLADQADD